MGSPVEITWKVNGKQSNAASGAMISLLGGKTASQNIIFTITNVVSEVVSFTSYKHNYRRSEVEVSLSDQFNVDKEGPHSIQPTESCWVKVKLTPKEYGGISFQLGFMFNEGNNSQSTTEKKITFDCVTEDAKRRRMFNFLAPKNNSHSDDEYADEDFDNLTIVELDERAAGQLLYTIPLDHYHIPGWINRLVFGPHTEEKMNIIIEKLKLMRLTMENYNEFFSNLLFLEELQLWRDMHHYVITSAEIVKDRNTDREGNTRFRLKVPGLAEKRPSILRGDRLYVIPLPPDEFKYEGKVYDTSRNDAYLVLNPRFEEDIADIGKQKFRIEFTLDRQTLRQMHRAVDIIKVEEMADVLFPTPFQIRPMKDPETLQLDCFESRVEENPEQLTAVKHIVAGTSRPAPYLIYGPPGTGKTFTLVEAIKQVCKIYPASKVLVCAPQNDAADLIAKRLLDHVPANTILRLNASSRSCHNLSDEILGISNYSRVSEKVVFPPKEEIADMKIVISTLVTSGRLVGADMTDHFTHIFIDEAGHATEPETVIPLGLLNRRMKNGGQVVLAGDPKQLGPIVRSTIASKYGLGLSLLERLMMSPNGLYSKDETRDDSTYNNDFVTKLLKNFRSHPQILEVPNQRFYQFELQPCADVAEREKFCGWKYLPDFTLLSWEMDQIGFPLIFYQVIGREEQEMSSPSWFNRHEILVVVDYVEKLLFGKSQPNIEAKDIGIISPYIQQVRKIKQALTTIESITSDQLSELKVGSVEKFQGDEREVIIISTVRSQTDKLPEDKKFNLGFVSNPKRFNVAITRAKSLLTVIGNPAVLCTDENWRRLIDHITNGGGYVGEPLTESMLRIEEEDLNEAMNAENHSTEDVIHVGGASIYLLHNDDEMVRNY